MLEIERQYKLNGEIPEDKIKFQYHIEQVYSNIASGISPDVRIRKITQSDGEETYFHTVKYYIKSEGKNTREEIEQPITKEQYDRIFEFINKKPVRKERIIVDISNNLLAEVDKFEDGNVIVEVEFLNQEAMNNFINIKPNWIGSEIKNKQSYSVFIFSKINNELSGIQKLQHYINKD